MKGQVIYNLNQLTQVFTEAKALLMSGPIRGGMFEAFNARSLKQNSTLHMWFTEIANQFLAQGHDEFANGDPMTMQNVKKHLKHTYLAMIPVQHLDLDTGEVTITHELPSTSELPRNEMCHFMDQINEWARNHMIKLTIPINSEYQRYLQEIGEAA